MRQKTRLNLARAKSVTHLGCSHFQPEADAGGLRRQRQRAPRLRWLSARRRSRIAPFSIWLMVARDKPLNWASVAWVKAMSVRRCSTGVTRTRHGRIAVAGHWWPLGRPCSGAVPCPGAPPPAMRQWPLRDGVPGALYPTIQGSAYPRPRDRRLSRKTRAAVGKPPGPTTADLAVSSAGIPAAIAVPIGNQENTSTPTAVANHKNLAQHRPS
jgi:hypothetical protein